MSDYAQRLAEMSFEPLRPQRSGHVGIVEETELVEAETSVVEPGTEQRRDRTANKPRSLLSPETPASNVQPDSTTVPAREGPAVVPDLEGDPIEQVATEPAQGTPEPSAAPIAVRERPNNVFQVLETVTRWMSEPNPSRPQPLGVSSAEIAAPHLSRRSTQAQRLVEEPKPSLEPKSIIAPSLEGTTELSIGTVHVTVEQPPVSRRPLEPAAPAKRAKRESAASNKTRWRRRYFRSV